MKAKKRTPPSGEIRSSQIISTFGPGAMVDLPEHSIVVGGLDHWFGERRRIHEERLAGRVADLLGLPDVALYAPPIESPDPAAPRAGITAFTFPIWFVAQTKDDTFTVGSKTYRTRPLVPWAGLVKGKYLNADRKSIPVVPVRFVQACVKGHLSDLDWYRFVHEDGVSKCRGQLWLDEGGTGGDLGDIYVRCEACKLRRVLANATVPNGKVLGQCRGHRPWLGPKASEVCPPSEKTGEPEYNRLLIRSASNAYFAQVLSVISIPDKDALLRAAVDMIWEEELRFVDDLDELTKLRKKGKPKVSTALAGQSDGAVWAEIERRKNPVPTPPKSIKQAEVETLLSSPTEIGEDRPEGDFHARARANVDLPPILKGILDRVVLVHRLREVQAQIGFTRFESVMPDVDGELALGVQPGALAIDPTWVPAAENRGEGVFLSFSPEAIAAWLKRPLVKLRGEELERGFDAWRARRGAEEARFPGLPYIMLHSLSHLLITAVALECGYAASSIRERVYAGEKGYGILLYTGSPGSEGTLGGLVAVGRRIEQHMETAVELGRLCSNDPVCAQHTPENRFEERFLHGAACHGCLLIAESSCERRNELLDRSLVIATVDGRGAELLREGGG